MVYKWLENVQHWLYPPSCVLCGQAGAQGRDLCASCRQALPWRTGALCPCCGEALANAAGLRCGRCLTAPPAVDRVLAPFAYASPVNGLVTALKFRARLSYARVLGDLLVDWLEGQAPAWPEALVPVPLHGTRLAARGFNQALELARPAARRLDLPLLTRGIARRRDTPAQSDLNARARRANVRRAFVVSGEIPARVAIVDDVVTTGATVDALARALRRAGARDIAVWSLARA